MSHSCGMRRVIRLTLLCGGLVLLPAQANASDVADDVAKGVRIAALAAAGGARPLVDTICPLMQEQAEVNRLPPLFLVRLIWRESRFNPQAISPKGAQGIAQFMPGTAADRGLDDPFEPKMAIIHSASLLADLRDEFGNIGLAAAAYNAGAERVRQWLASTITHLPWETEAYVLHITGRAADEWKDTATELPEELKQQEVASVQESCRNLAPTVVRALYETGPSTPTAARRPWGVKIATDFSRTKALSRFTRLKQQYKVLADAMPFVQAERNLSRGRRAMFAVQVGADSQDAANKLCSQLRAGGGACMVAKN